MNDEITPENFHQHLWQFRAECKMSDRQIATPIGCPAKTVSRLAGKITRPTQEMIEQFGIMLAVGYERYRKLSKAEKRKIAEAVGSAGGGAVGVASISAIISSSGTVAGLSGAGITSGLAAIGSTVGGGMVAGVCVCVAVPAAAVGVGYGCVKIGRAIGTKLRLDRDEVDPRWETQ